MESYQLNIPENDSKAAALISYLKTLDFVELVKPIANNTEIPSWQQQEVREQLAEYKANPKIGVHFDTAMNTIEKEL